MLRCNMIPTGGAPVGLSVVQLDVHTQVGCLAPVATNERPANSDLTNELRDTMSTTTVTFGPHSATGQTAAPAAAPRKGLYQRFIDARLRQGRAHASAVLSRMSDTQLAELGLSSDQIREVRSTGAVPMSFWG